MRIAALLLCLAALAPAARAEVQTGLVVILGSKLTPAQAKAAHARSATLTKKHRLEIFDDPSLTWNPAPPTTTYAGRVLARVVADRTTQAVALSVPTATQIDGVKKDLGAAGLPTDVRLIALIVYSGGK